MLHEYSVNRMPLAHHVRPVRTLMWTVQAKVSRVEAELEDRGKLVAELQASISAAQEGQSALQLRIEELQVCVVLCCRLLKSIMCLTAADFTMHGVILSCCRPPYQHEFTMSAHTIHPRFVSAVADSLPYRFCTLNALQRVSDSFMQEQVEKVFTAKPLESHSQVRHLTYAACRELRLCVQFACAV